MLDIKGFNSNNSSDSRELDKCIYAIFFTFKAKEGRPSSNPIFKSISVIGSIRGIGFLVYLSRLILRNRANLLRIFDRFLSLRYFGEIC